MADTKKSSDIFDTIDTFRKAVKMSKMSKISPSVWKQTLR